MAHVHLQPEGEYRTSMRTLIGARWRDLWEALPAVTADDNPEAVHDVRVASRRLRAAMDAAVTTFPPKWFRPLHKLSKQITKALGDVRDRDVLLESLSAERPRADPAEWPAIDHLIARITRERKDARVAMHTFLEDLDVHRMKGITRRRFHDVSPKKASAEPAERELKEKTMTDGQHPSMYAPTESVAAKARHILANRIAELFSFAPLIPDPSAQMELHRARIAARRLRYTLETFDTVFDDEGARLITELTSLQDILGETHDLDVRINLIHNEHEALTEGRSDNLDLERSLSILLKRERSDRAHLHKRAVTEWTILLDNDLRERLVRLSALPVMS